MRRHDVRTIEVQHETAAARRRDRATGPTPTLASGSNGFAPPPLEAAWFETVETTALRRAPKDVDAADVLPTPLGER
jgi:hypothetical protein